MSSSSFYITSFLLFIILASFSSWSKHNIFLLQEKYSSEVNLIDTPIYLPEKRAVQFVTLGYEHFFSTILWFRTLHYFGAKFEAKESMPWFSHMCELVTELDPKSRHVFESCATLMSWIAREPKRSVELLTNGITNDESYWRYYYLRGFIYWYFLEEFQKARSDFEFAARLENAPVFLSSLATRLMSYENDFDSAITFLKSSLSQAEDERVKNALGQRLKLAYVSRDIYYIKQAISRFNEEKNSHPDSLKELLEYGYVTNLPVDPFDDEYIYDSVDNSVKSLHGGFGLKFHGKTAKTGIAKQEGWVSNED